MIYAFKPLNINWVKRIATWRMGFKGEFVDMQAYFESYAQEEYPLRGPGKCQGFAVLYSGRLVGLFEYYRKGDDFEIGLAMAPKLRGKGYGTEFVEEGIIHGRKIFPSAKKIYLEVSELNKPAIKIYQKLGFEEVGRGKGSIRMTRYLN